MYDTPDCPHATWIPSLVTDRRGFWECSLLGHHRYCSVGPNGLWDDEQEKINRDAPDTCPHKEEVARSNDLMYY